MAEAASPRALTFEWGCSNDDSLNFFLKGVTTGLVALGQGTPEMAAHDKVPLSSEYGIYKTDRQTDRQTDSQGQMLDVASRF